MNIKKAAAALLLINVLQFILGLALWILTGRTIKQEISVYLSVSIGLMLLSSLITIFGLYFAVRYKNDDFTDTIKNLEELNTKLRAQRHDYINHFQVIYGLLELEEYEEAKKYIEPVFKDIMKISKALKTVQPAVNALLQAKMEAAEQKKIHFYLEIRSDLKAIPMEAWNLCKVLANLIDNSITALSDVTYEKRIQVEIAEDLNHYLFLIRNNGPEIPEDRRADIFKKGYTTKKGEEHGMGLYIVSRIVQEAGGLVQVDSNIHWTSFRIRLPKAVIS